jgi:hypothetical protein
MIAGMLTRKRLVDKRREIEQVEGERLDKMIEMAAKESAI